MKRIVQVDLLVDGDGPIAVLYRYRKGYRLAQKTYRARSVESPSAKAHFLKRVHALQMALCAAGGNDAK